MTKREWTAALLQSAGMIFGFAAGWLVAPALGFAVLAVALILFGLALERRR